MKKKKTTPSTETPMRTPIAIPALAPMAMGCAGNGVFVALSTGIGGEAIGRIVLVSKVVEDAAAVNSNVDCVIASVVWMLSLLKTLVCSTIDVLVTKIVEGAADGAPGALDWTDVTTTTCELVKIEV